MGALSLFFSSPPIALSLSQELDFVRVERAVATQNVQESRAKFTLKPIGVPTDSDRA
jgi:hypothetical protein